MPLTGTLRDLSLSNLVQLQCTEQAHAQVLLTQGNQKGILVFSNGDLISASVSDKTGEDAVYELLTWEEGTFRVDNENVTGERNVHAPWGALLLEGLRLADEARAERDTTVETALRNAKGKQGLRGALVTNHSGLIRADAKDQNTAEDAALIAFVAGRAETISSLLDLGSLKQFVTLGANDKIVMTRLASNYAAFWLEPRANADHIKPLLQSLQTPQ